MIDRQVNAKVTYPTLGYTVLSTGQDIRRDENVEVIVHVGMREHGMAWFECYDRKTEGEAYHAEGELDVQDNKLVDYDGVGSLPTVVMDIARDKFGVDVSEVYDDDGQPNEYEVFMYWVDGKCFHTLHDARQYIHSLKLDLDANRAKFKEIQRK
jgi:hypothetical protein|tara:strand:- start:99 stop:560 length:462 start_codon:yes stop_codon:yes gene_type:complete